MQVERCCETVELYDATVALYYCIMQHFNCIVQLLCSCTVQPFVCKDALALRCFRTREGKPHMHVKERHMHLHKCFKEKLDTKD